MPHQLGVRRSIISRRIRQIVLPLTFSDQESVTWNVPKTLYLWGTRVGQWAFLAPAGSSALPCPNRVQNHLPTMTTIGTLSHWLFEKMVTLDELLSWSPICSNSPVVALGPKHPALLCTLAPRPRLSFRESLRSGEDDFLVHIPPLIIVIV